MVGNVVYEMLLSIQPHSLPLFPISTPLKATYPEPLHSNFLFVPFPTSLILETFGTARSTSKGSGFVSGDLYRGQSSDAYASGFALAPSIALIE